MNDTQLPQIGPMRKSPARTVELFDFSIAAEPPAMPAAHGLIDERQPTYVTRLWAASSAGVFDCAGS